jgi:sugar/nucleoside kinase (ribokinase family)
MTSGGPGGYHVVVVGGVNTDYLVKGERLPGRGETLEGEVFQEAPGGKGANQAVAVARLGCRVALIARIGTDDRGKRILDQLTTEGVDLRYIRRDDDALTGVALMDPSGESFEPVKATARSAQRAARPTRTTRISRPPGRAVFT